jgi:hypothetical protein
MKVTVALLIAMCLAGPVLAERTRAVTPVPTVWTCTTFLTASDAYTFAGDAGGVGPTRMSHVVVRTDELQPRFIVFSTSAFLAWPSVYRDFVPFADEGDCRGAKFSVVDDPAVALALYGSKVSSQKGLASSGQSWIVWWRY